MIAHTKQEVTTLASQLDLLAKHGFELIKELEARGILNINGMPEIREDVARWLGLPAEDAAKIKFDAKRWHTFIDQRAINAGYMPAPEETKKPH